MHIIFGTPREGQNTARGGAAFTPRGTLVAVAQASGRNQAVTSLGVPLKQAGTVEGTAEEPMDPSHVVNMNFAKDWVTKVFETPRGGADDDTEMRERVAEAAQWLQLNFGMTPRGDKDDEGRTPRTADMENQYAAMAQLFTPRAGGASQGFTKKTDDAALANAMQAALVTPRAPTATASVDDTPMAGAVNKMFSKKYSL